MLTNSTSKGAPSIGPVPFLTQKLGKEIWGENYQIATLYSKEFLTMKKLGL